MIENFTNAEDLNKRTIEAKEKIMAGGKDALDAHFELNKLAKESENVKEEAELENTEFDKKKKSEMEINDNKIESHTSKPEGNEQKEEMEFLQKTLQECYEGKLKFFDLWNKKSQELMIKHIEEISQNKNVKINISEALQLEYNRRISNGYTDERNGGMGIKYLAQEKNADLILRSDDLQHGYEELLMKGLSTNEIEELAKNNNIVLEEINEDFLQRAFDSILKKLSNGIDQQALNNIWELSKEKGINLKVNQNMIDENPPIEGEMRHKRLKYFFEENNIDIDIKTVSQDEEAMQEENNSEDIFRNITSYGKNENRYPEEFESKIQAEETYIKLIHDINTAHVDGPRKRILENLSSYNSDLTYEKVAKMDYLEYLKVPEDQRLKVENITTIDNIPVAAIFYCKKEKTPVAGKFILGVNDKNEIKLVFDSTMGEHRDIGAKYDLEVMGGGWIQIDEENKRIGIFSQSSDFGIEPRQMTKKIVSESFPGYEIFIGQEK